MLIIVGHVDIFNGSSDVSAHVMPLVQCICHLLSHLLVKVTVMAMRQQKGTIMM